MGSTPSISEDAWQEISEGRSSAYRESAYRGFECIEFSPLGVTIRDLPMRSEPSVHTGQVSEIGRKSQIGKSTFPRTWNARNRKSRSAISRWDQHRPSARMHGERSQRVGVRHIGVQCIRDFKDMKYLHYKTAICEFSTPS